MVATKDMHPMNLYGHTHPEDVGDYIESDPEVEILYKPFFDELVHRNDETNQSLHDLADFIEYEYAKDILG